MVYDDATALVDVDGADDASVGGADDVAVAHHVAVAHDEEDNDASNASQAPPFLAGCDV